MNKEIAKFEIPNYTVKIVQVEHYHFKVTQIENGRLQTTNCNNLIDAIELFKEMITD